MRRGKLRLPNRFAPIVLAVAAIALAGASTASAKIWFRGIDRTVTPGERVTAHVPGCAWNVACERNVVGIRVFIVKAGATPEAAVPVGRPRLVGKIASGGRLRFRIPRLPTGSYRLFASVRSGPGPRRELVPVSDIFEIVRTAARR